MLKSQPSHQRLEPRACAVQQRRLAVELEPVLVAVRPLELLRLDEASKSEKKKNKKQKKGRGEGGNQR